MNPTVNEVKAAHPPRSKWAGAALVCACLLWLCAMGAGWFLMGGYKNVPGEAGAPPESWPAQSHLRREAGQAVLVMAAHPRCPCTRASVEQLSRLMARAQGRVRAYVVLLRPEGFSEGWEKTDLWQSAAAIPGVSVVADPGAAEARRLGVSTSGHVVLYDADGRRLFSGGITAARGHAGDNSGSDALLALLMQGEAERAETRVFGCPLFAPRSECPAGKEAPHVNPRN